MKKVIILILIALTTIIGVVVIDQAMHPLSAKDCSTNAVAKCGVWSVKEMRNAYNNDTTKGLRNIYNGMGITSDTVNNATVKEGYVHKDGRITIGSEVVATNAISAGRTKINDKRIKQTYNGTTYYTSKTQDTFKASKISAYVFLDAYGRFLGAVLHDCGNPIKGTPTKPKPSLTCDLLGSTPISRTTFRFTASATAKDGAKISGHTFVFGDGTSKKQSGATIDHAYTKPGTYTATVTVHSNLPDATSAKCKVTVKVAPEPTAACTNLTATVTKRTNVALSAKATAANGATIKSYTFTVTDSANKEVFKKTVSSTATSANTSTVIETPGTYKAKVVVSTSVGDKTIAACNDTFTIDREKVPGVSIVKKVDGQDHKEVLVDQTFVYQLTVTNKGETNLTNVKVTDPAPQHVQLLTADKGTITDNGWSYTIPSLKVGESVNFTITAKVTKEVEGRIKNTACVDAPAVPGNPDDCDDATVEVPPTPVIPDITVCDLDSKTIIQIKEDAFDSAKHSTDFDDCKEVVVPPTPVEPEVPAELPKTGIADTLTSIVALSTLVGTTIAYSLSRRSII